ncbi:MAG: ATP-binding protein [Polyangiales bacterium]
MDASGRLANLDPDRREALRREADAAIARRSIVGAVAAAVTVIAFAALLRGDARYTRVAPAFGVLALASLMLRVSVHRRTPRRDAAASAWRAWVRLRGVTTAFNLGVFALHCFVAMACFGLQSSTLVMLLAQGSVLAGVTYAQAPRPGLMHGLQLMIVGAPLAAVLIRHDEHRGMMAVMLLVELSYAVLLGRRLCEEYWQEVLLRVRLEDTGAALAALERQTREIVERTPDATGIVRDGVVVFVNAAWASLLGAAPADLTGARLEDLAHPQHRATVRALLAGAHGDALPHEVLMRRADGTYATWEVSPAEPLRDEGQTGQLVVARDVTERNRLRAHLMHAERMSSIGTLAAGFAHEINNPLTYVIANVGQAREGLRAGATTVEVDEALREAEQGAERVRAIVRDLRTFSRVDDAEIAPVDLNAAIDFAVKMTANEVRHRARVERDTPATLPRVLANEARLAQVFVNLLVNAAQAIPEGAAADNVVRVRAWASTDDDVLVEVSDSGSGIAPEVLAQIFDPFFTTKAVGVGMGLGLSICHASVRSFGGEISARSGPEGGATFRLRLRAAPSVPVAAAPDDAAAAAPTSRRSTGRILLVDDEPTLLRSLARQLRRYGEVATASDGAAALARLQAERFDAVLCDLMMPEMTGMELFARVRESLPDCATRFVFMTGGAFTPASRAFAESSARPVLDKPLDFARLERALDEVLAAGATSAS